MINIRNATLNDLQPMLDIYNEIIMNTTAVFQYHLHTLEQRKEWFAQKEKENYPVFIAEENNMVVGFSTFGQFRNWQAYKYSVENSVYVKADCRGKGIGKLLLQPLIDAAREMPGAKFASRPGVDHRGAVFDRSSEFVFAQFLQRREGTKRCDAAQVQVNVIGKISRTIR